MKAGWVNSVGRIFVFSILSVVSVILFCYGTAFAHKVKIFASVEGNSISGYVYYTSSARAKNVDVEFIGPDGSIFDRLKTNDNGEFKLKARYRVDTLISLVSVDGHGAKWLVSADEFPAELPAYADTSGDVHRIDADVEEAAPVAEHKEGGIENSELMPLLRRELRPLQEQITQLRSQIDMQEEQKHLQDILGGIGYIFGLTGIFFYFAAKRRREHN